MGWQASRGQEVSLQNHGASFVRLADPRRNRARLRRVFHLVLTPTIRLMLRERDPAPASTVAAA